MTFGKPIRALTASIALVAAGTAVAPAAQAQAGPLSSFKPDKVAATNVTMVTANIQQALSPAGAVKALRASAVRGPDFINLNEMNHRSKGFTEAALGKKYRAVRPTVPGNATQVNSNMIAYRADLWTRKSSGRVTIVAEDKAFFKGRRVDWPRHAVWGTFKNKKTGKVVSVVSTHHMINPAIDKAQWGNPELNRVQIYSRGMHTLIGTVKMLKKKTGSTVLVGGDMNSPNPKLWWSAGAQMSRAGYTWKQRGVDYVFYPKGSKNVQGLTGYLPADHGAWVGVKLTV